MRTDEGRGFPTGPGERADNFVGLVRNDDLARTDRPGSERLEEVLSGLEGFGKLDLDLEPAVLGRRRSADDDFVVRVDIPPADLCLGVRTFEVGGMVETIARAFERDVHGTVGRGPGHEERSAGAGKSARQELDVLRRPADLERRIAEQVVVSD